MEKSRGNIDLYKYLVRLGELLQGRKHHSLAEIVQRASFFAAGSPSEFLHEALLALESVAGAQSVLDTDEAAELRTWISAIKDGFNAVGGA